EHPSNGRLGPTKREVHLADPLIDQQRTGGGRRARAPLDHESHGVTHVDGIDAHVRVRRGPNPENLVGEALPDRIDAPEIDYHVSEALETDDDSLGLRTRNEVDAAFEQLDDDARRIKLK